MTTKYIRLPPASKLHHWIVRDKLMSVISMHYPSEPFSLEIHVRKILLMHNDTVVIQVYAWPPKFGTTKILDKSKYDLFLHPCKVKKLIDDFMDEYYTCALK